MDRQGYVERVVALAQERYSRDGAIQIDADAAISDGSDNGTYVQAWVWVDFTGTELDKEKRA